MKWETGLLQLCSLLVCVLLWQNWTKNQLINTDGFLSREITWDGRDDFGDQLGKGVYIYHLKVKNPDGQLAEKTEKLVLLK
jgi:hypothetical protein